MEKKVSDLKSRRVDFLKKYVKKEKLEESFYEFALSCIHTLAIEDSINVYVENRNFLQSKGMYSQLMINTAASLSTQPFQKANPYFYQAADILMSAVVLKRNYLDIQSPNEFQLLFGFIINNFNNLLKDHLLIHIFILADRANIKLPSSCGDFYKKEIIPKYSVQEENTDFGKDKLLHSDLITIKDFNGIMQQYKDSIVLIDVWASWCGPCRKEIPFFKLLEEKYRNKPIKFVSISIDENPFKWIEAAEEEKLLPGDSYLLFDYNNTNLIRLNKVSTIPHFILFDKQGHVISTETPWPSNAILVELLNNSLSSGKDSKHDTSETRATWLSVAGNVRL